MYAEVLEGNYLNCWCITWPVGFKRLNCWCITWPVGFKRLIRKSYSIYRQLLTKISFDTFLMHYSYISRNRRTIINTFALRFKCVRISANSRTYIIRHLRQHFTTQRSYVFLTSSKPVFIMHTECVLYEVKTEVLCTDLWFSDRTCASLKLHCAQWTAHRRWSRPIEWRDSGNPRWLAQRLRS